MIVGLGSDLVEVEQIRRELGRTAWRTDDSVFTSAEVTWCSSGKQPASRFALCFAAKEAVLKALGTGVADLEMFHEVETEFASPLERRIVLRHRLQTIAAQLGVRHISLSVAVARKSVAAMVVLES